MNEERTRRVARNEALYRQVNERIGELSEAFAQITGDFNVVCECGDLHCAEQIQLPHESYQRVRAQPHLFVLKPGHEELGVEAVVEKHTEYLVVEKDEGLPSRIAEETDPRR